jgi:hypothetical protein
MFSDIVRVCQIQQERSVVYTRQSFLFEFVLLSRLITTEMFMPNQLYIHVFENAHFKNILHTLLLMLNYFMVKT